MSRYNAKISEPKWQQAWTSQGSFEVEVDPSRPKYYVLEMFPYPSGTLHMGNFRVYCLGDVLAHHARMKGYEVLHPMGFDALGLPAENAAIERNIHQATWVHQNIRTTRDQFKRMGISYDWDREIMTCAPEYYRWTQWLFLKFLARDLVYRKKDTFNWCASCETVLANEQVEQGSCWRCGKPVTAKEAEGWFFRITAYANQLLEDLSLLDGKWQNRILVMQRNWIGRSEGVEVNFPIADTQDTLKIFTTRIDTIFGATFMVVAPEHPLAQRHAERQLPFAINPATKEKIPIWVATYVVMEYGTGAIMAVPSHDVRDAEFAKQHGLPFRQVITPPAPVASDEAYEGEGVMVRSGAFNGLPSQDARPKMAEWVEQQRWGSRKTTFRIRDWSLSRQRYWGEPIPIVHCDQCGIVPVPLDELPVRLPERMAGGEGRMPTLDKIPEFVNTTCPRCGRPAKRETDTMDAFVASSWYYLRYADPRNNAAPFAREKADHWVPVDLYIGGPEHATKHMIYARFFHKVMRDMGLLSSSEPFDRFLTNGIVYFKGAKMSKSKGNVVSPEDLLDRYGADTARVFIYFAAPPQMDLEWNEGGVEGAFRFLTRVSRWIGRLSSEKGRPATPPEDPALVTLMHQTIQRVTRDIEVERQFNTAISALMECLNALEDTAGELTWAAEIFVKLLAPFAPHLACESWEQLGHDTCVLAESWPPFDPNLARPREATIVVQINGRVRSKLMMPMDSADEVVRQACLEDERVKRMLNGKTIQKVIVVKNRIVNIVIT